METGSVIDIVKVFTAASISFFLGLLVVTPIFSHFAYKYKWWKKTGSKGEALLGGTTVEFDKLYGNKEAEIKTPRMGGIVVWGSVTLTTILMYVLAHTSSDPTLGKLDFLSRNQTWLPLFTLLSGALVGMASDIFDIKTSETGAAKGLSLRSRILIVIIIGIIGGVWFYSKLGVTLLPVPYLGLVSVGIGIIPIFTIWMLGMYSGGIIDGIDGLSGGVFASMYGAYALIAFFQGQTNIATFCAAVVGGLLAFLWFNIPPARFWMTETGTMALTLTITVIAFLTSAIFPLLLIGLPLIATSASNIVQLISRKVFGKKLFRIAPLHHHFEAIGWPAYKVTMRYWVLSIIFAVVGTVLALM